MAEQLSVGHITTLERDAERASQARAFLSEAGVDQRVSLVEGDARETIAGLEGPFELLFVDAQKADYRDYIELALPLLSPRALVAIDNLLMSGEGRPSRGQRHLLVGREPERGPLAEHRDHGRRRVARRGPVGRRRRGTGGAGTSWGGPPPVGPGRRPGPGRPESPVRGESIVGPVTADFASIESTRERLGEVGYLADEAAALVSFLAGRLGKPVLVEGPAGVGKTELAKALARATGRSLVRLQCYEGLDEAKALYEWNYRKQLLRIQTEATPGGEADRGWQQVKDDIFGEEFLLSRPLLTAIEAEEPVVLLIDEIDKTDQEFEAMLLEVLSDFQVSIPELGAVRARSRPLVLLTSNDSRELTEALKRRCLYLWLDYPDSERELEIVRLHAPELGEQVARKLVEVVHMVRALDLKKPPSIAESIDWARALLLLGAEDVDHAVLEKTMSIIVKHRTDLDLVAERVGVKLAADGLFGASRQAG